MAKTILRRISVALEGFLGTIAAQAFARPIQGLVLATVVTLGAGYAASTLQVDADLTNLLPRSFKSVQALDILRERFGPVGYVVVVAQDSEPKVLKDFVRDAAAKVEELESVWFVDYQRPQEYFEERSLFFFDREDLRLIADRLTEREAYERRTRNPMYIDLEGAEPPSLEFKEIRDKYSNSEAADFQGRVNLEDSYYIDKQERMAVMFVKPAERSTDLAFAKQVVSEVKSVVGGMDLSRYPDLKVDYAGTFTKKVDLQVLIEHDLRTATLVAMLLMVIFVAIHFRRLAAVAFIMVPLLMGLVWTYGFAAAVFGMLNVLTGFIGAILLGLGIDHGIHLLGRFESEYWNKESPIEAARTAFGSTGRGVTIAALTTMVAFIGLSFSEFRAFREFGAISAAGILLVVTAYVTCLPALLGLFHRFGFQPQQTTKLQPSKVLDYVMTRPGKLLVALGILAALAFINIRNAYFDHNTRSLADSSLPSFKLDKHVDRLLGYSQTPVVVLANGTAEERLIADALRNRSEELGEDSVVDLVAATADLLPLNQEEKIPLLREIGEVLNNIKTSWLDKEDRPMLRTLRKAAQAEPFTREDLPPEVKRQFQSPKGVESGFVLVFADVDLSDGKAVSQFAKEVRGAKRDDGGPMYIAGEPLIFADVYDMVAREAPPVLAGTLLMVFLTMWLLVGHLGRALIAMVPAVATLGCTLGLLSIIDLDLNYLNIVMVPVLFGVGVDGGVHVVTRMGHTPLPQLFNELGRAIAGALLTTGLGFGALMIADHQGLDSMGHLAVVGLMVNLLACLVLLPALLAAVGAFVKDDESSPEN